ncbi:MAG: sulfite exporter TauE/SafE family protein [Solirubrobacteraceae bacterium]
MSAGSIAALVLVGLLAGVIAGLLGVGGGIVFIPGLVLVLGVSQHVAEGTSLLAILPVVIVGAASQRRYGNVRQRDALLVGMLSLGGATGGVALANALSGKALQIAFAALMLLIAVHLLRRSLPRP